MSQKIELISNLPSNVQDIYTKIYGNEKNKQKISIEPPMFRTKGLKIDKDWLYRQSDHPHPVIANMSRRLSDPNAELTKKYQKLLKKIEKSNKGKKSKQEEKKAEEESSDSDEQEGSGSDWMHSWYSWSAIGGPGAITNYTLKYIDQAPMFHPYETGRKFPTGTTGIVPDSLYIAQVEGWNLGEKLDKLDRQKLNQIAENKGISDAQEMEREELTNIILGMSQNQDS